MTPLQWAAIKSWHSSGELGTVADGNSRGQWMLYQLHPVQEWLATIRSLLSRAGWCSPRHPT